MTATLTPSSVDSDTIQDLEDHWKDRVECQRKKYNCHADATVIIQRRCCGRIWFSCKNHLHEYRARIEEELRRPLPTHRCTLCDKRHPHGTTFNDMHRVVPL